MRPDPSQELLDQVLSKCDRIQILAGADDDSVLLDCTGTKDIQSLERALRIIEDPATFDHCWCCGEERVVLSMSDEVLADISLHHGVSIRWSAWSLDARLVDGTLLLNWLAERGLSEPLERYRLLVEQEEAMIEEARRWYSATPKGLREYAGALVNQQLGQAVFVPTTDIGTRGTRREEPTVQEHHKEIVEAFCAEYPDPRERGAHLFLWLGYGSGLWSGYPAHESLTIDMLFTLATEHLVEAAMVKDPPPELRTGALRFFAGYHFNGRRGGEFATLPQELRSMLLEEAEKAEDENLRTHAVQVLKIRPGLGSKLRGLFGKRSGS